MPWSIDRTLHKSPVVELHSAPAFLTSVHGVHHLLVHLLVGFGMHDDHL